MARGILIMGPSGSGKTTLGRMVAESLGFPYFDIDDYIWRQDTPVPYTVMYSRTERIGRLMADITCHEYFVMAGSMSSFHAAFDPFFDLAVFLHVDVETTIDRVQRRAEERFGDRVRENGDMWEDHRKMIDNVSRYNTDGSPNLQEHLEWFDILNCVKLKLNGEDLLTENCQQIIDTYRKNFPCHKA